MEQPAKLSLNAGILMLLAGIIFGFLHQWIIAGLLWVGAFGCIMAALNYTGRKDS